ncbi:MAG TPA: hypothetical protein PLV41_06395, partial [Miltoncostaeales bacterium]|nr:hypothetical protein [Miltoncostaeales bacterium]
MSAATWVSLALALGALLALQLGPRLGLYRVNVVLSSSMKPHWQAGDLVITTPTARRICGSARSSPTTH